jgi:hypothetical protein
MTLATHLSKTLSLEEFGYSSGVEIARDFDSYPYPSRSNWQPT